MYCLIHCVRISKSVRLGFNKLLFASKLKTVCTRPTDRACHVFAFSNEKKFLKLDNLTADFELIYQLQSKKWWIFFACATYIMAVVTPVILLYPYISKSRRYYKPVDTEEMLENMFNDATAPRRDENIAYSLLAVGFNAFIFMLTKRYPLRIYFNGEKYVAVYWNGFFPLLRKHHYFEKARRTKSLLVFLPDSNYRLGSRNARLFVTNFRRPVDFQKMLVTPYYEPEEEN